MTVLLLLFILLIACIRFIPGAGELYATLLYPHISAFLSRVSSFVPFSLDEVVALLGILWLILTIVIGIRKAWKWQKTTGRVLKILLWYAVWFYLGWGCNYFRDDFFTRMQVAPAQADKEVFLRFADDFVVSLNQSWAEVRDKEEVKEKVEGKSEKLEDDWQKDSVRVRFEIDKEQVIDEIKRLYAHYLPPTSGLCLPKDYQQPKDMLLNGLYSASGVLGFMGPWMGENLLNVQLTPSQFPFTYAHELSHFLGVTSEAEANYWAYYICTHSKDPKIRYSGYSCLLPYVLVNAQTMLTEDEYYVYFASVRPEIIQERREISAFWQAQHIEIIDRCQTFLLDLQLKGNNIPSGTSNYNQVVAMIISMQENAKK